MMQQGAAANSSFDQYYPQPETTTTIAPQLTKEENTTLNDESAVRDGMFEKVNFLRKSWNFIILFNIQLGSLRGAVTQSVDRLTQQAQGVGTIFTDPARMGTSTAQSSVDSTNDLLFKGMGKGKEESESGEDAALNRDIGDSILGTFF